METSFAMISALIAIDAPRQIEWHLEGALRNGATREEVKAVREMAIQISKVAGVVWKQDIPNLNYTSIGTPDIAAPEQPKDVKPPVPNGAEGSPRNQHSPDPATGQGPPNSSGGGQVNTAPPTPSA